MTAAALQHPAGDDAARLAEAYRGFLRTLRLRQSKVGYILPLALVPAALALDYFVYPELLGPIFKSRVLCNLALAPCCVLLFTRYGGRLLWFLGNAWLIAPMLAISWMIYASEGSDSPYYAGLNLVMLAACLLTTYNARRAMAFCGTVIVSYSAACALHAWAPPESALHKSVLINGDLLFNNLYFLTATAAVCVASCYFGARRRFEDFRLRHDLDENNARLADTIKKLQATEVQLVQSEKMNALGKLSAGLLHEINNPLNFTFMALQLAEEEAGENASLKETLADISQGMTRIKGVVSDLRAFAHPSKLSDAETFPVADALTTALRLTAHEVGDIPVDRAGVEGAVAVGAKTQIVHVLMNLVVNSVHAMRDHGGPPLGRAPRIVVECAPRADGRLEIAVRDNGAGVAPADLPRLLEPFFTTKAPGKGTGLGLSICHTIVGNHGGQIAVTSEHGQWTRVAFDLALPAAATTTTDPAPVAPAQAFVSEPATPSEMVTA